MRVLAACRECKRQYDASGRAPGSQFHCACGEMVEVPRPDWHDAAVVRCAECGAPREREADTCTYCGAGFTLHEQDMHTICPECTTRVSDKARYCHRCATAILPQGTAGEDTDKSCPVCGEDASRLVSRTLGGEGLTVLECGGCGGLWLGAGVFRILEDRAREKERDYHLPGTEAGAGASAGSLQQQGPMYRPCIDCGQLMARRNYARKSGVIIDVCKDHGIWFDHGELGRILSWIREGGLSRAETLGREQERRAQRQQRMQMQRTSVPEPYFGSSSTGPSGGFGDFLTDVFDFLD